MKEQRKDKFWNIVKEEIENELLKGDPNIDIDKEWKSINDSVEEYLKSLVEDSPEEANNLLKAYMPEVLYHGTDMRSVKMSKESRNKWRSLYIHVIDYLYSIYEKYIDANGSAYEVYAKIPKSETLLRKSFPTLLQCWFFRKGGNPYYQYNENGIHLTFEKNKAANYAYNAFAFGELGRIAINLIRVMQYLPADFTNIPQDIQKMISDIKEYAEGKSTPVILEFRNVNTDNLFGLGLGMKKSQKITIANLHLYDDVWYEHDSNSTDYQIVGLPSNQEEYYKNLENLEDYKNL